MKILISILLLFPIIVFGQWIGSPGEYVNLLLNTSTHRAYTVDNGVPTIVPSPTNVVLVAGGPHSAALVDNTGRVYCKGQNPNGVVPNGTQTDQNSFVICMTDNLGNTLDSVVQVFLSGNANKGAFWNIFAVTYTGKLYGAGELESYVIGDGTAGTAVNTRWVRINVGSGVDTFVTKVQGGYGMLAKTAAGSAYTWGADRDGFINGQGTTTAATTPTKVSLPGGKTVLDIASNGLLHAIVLSDGTKAMTGQQNLNDYAGIYPTAMTRSFQDVTTALGLPAGAKSVSMNASTTYWILTTGAMWSHGDNSCGTIGNGDMLDWGAYKCCPGPSSGSPAPYNYDNGFHEHMVITPVEPVPGKRDWKSVTTCASNSWFAYATDSANRFYTWGRNKFGPLVNSIIGANPVNGGIGAQYPDSWSIPWITEQFPASITAYVQSTSPYCLLNPSGSPCNTYTPPTNVKPTASLVTRALGNNAIILDASGSTDDVFIMSYLHTQLTGTALQLKIRTGKIDTVTSVPAGTYSFKIRVTDNGFLSDSTTSTVSVGLNCNCPYYFATAGSDANPGTQASPKKTMTALSSLASDTTATFFLNRNDTFAGPITNFAGRRLDAYGTGVRPVVTGMITLTGWTNVTGSIYQAACPGCNLNTNLVLVNGLQQIMGRTPNTGYYPYQSFSGTTTITSSSLTGTPNYSGGQVVIRQSNAAISTNKITSQSTSILTYTSAIGQTPTANFGLFIINDSLTLDTAYEWYYSPGLATMKMYFPSGPTGILVQVTAIDTLLSIAAGEKNDTIQNIDFEGAGICGICMSTDTGILIRNVKIRYSGGLGYYAARGVNLRIDSSHVSYCNDQGIYIDSSSVNGYIGHDTVRTAGYIVGQGRTFQGDNYRGITNKSHLGIIEYNRVDSTGYDAIMGYQYSLIYKNYASKFCFVADDGGGIYSLGYKIGADTARLQYIRGNVLANGIGASLGTNNLTFKPAYGIYTDNNNVNVVIDSNTVDSMAHSGIFNHNSRLLITKNNTVYACAVSALQVQGDDATKPVRQNTTKNNYFGINLAGQQTFRFVPFNNIQFTATYGTIDSNSYFYTNLNATPFFVYPSTNMGYKQWQDSTGDIHGRVLVAPTLFQANNTQAPLSVPLLGKNYYDAINKSYFTTATIPPLASLMLIPGSFIVLPLGIIISIH